MSEQTVEKEEITLSAEQQELNAIKQELDQLGVSYHPSIGLEKAKERLAEASPAKEETIPQRNKRLRNEASRLVRIMVTCMNPTKKDWEGEIFTVGNSIVGTHRKMVPFNVEYHVPHIIYEQMKNRKCQVFHTVKVNGRKVRKGKLIKEFAIDVLPPLTEAELKELAQMQAQAGGLD